MVDDAPSPGARTRRALLGFGRWPVALLVVLSLWLTHLALTRTQILVEPRVAIERYVAGTAAKPFCFRALVPWTMVGLETVVPAFVGDALCSDQVGWRGCALMPKDSQERRYHVALALILFASILTYALVVGHTFRRLFDTPAWSRCLVSVGALLVVAVVIRFGGYGHIYDFSVLALFASLLFALLFERVRLFFVLFAIACWTKETAILMTVAYAAVYFDRLPRARLIAHLALQVALYLGAQATVRHLFKDNPGGAIEVWYPQQIAWFMRKPAQRTLFFGVLAFGMLFGFREKPQALRRSALLLLPHLGLFFYGGQPAELRALYESFPIILLFAFRNVTTIPRSLLTKIQSRK